MLWGFEDVVWLGADLCHTGLQTTPPHGKGPLHPPWTWGGSVAAADYLPTGLAPSAIMVFMVLMCMIVYLQQPAVLAC